MHMIEIVDDRITSSLKKNKINLSKNDVDVLIIGHGSKDPNAKISIKYVVDGLKSSYRNVDHCFLEIEEPNIEQGINKSEKNNPKILVIVFYFLHKGAHVKRDIFEDLNPAIENSNLKNTIITEHIGTEDKMINLIIERAKEVEGQTIEPSWLRCQCHMVICQLPYHHRKPHFSRRHLYSLFPHPIKYDCIL